MDCSQEENNQNHTNLPSPVTLDVMVIPQKQETVIISTEEARNMLHTEQIKAEPIDLMDGDDKTEITLLPLPVESELSAGVHFLTDEDSSKSEEVYEKKKWDFLEYVPQSDGSVVCKRCGEVLASRTHWYRHKYKIHVNNFGNPSPLFKCEHCNVFFKSRKGFMGHYSTRHSETEPGAAEPSVPPPPPPPTTEPAAQVPSNPLKEDSGGLESGNNNNNNNKKRFADKTVDWEAQRIKEEKLVADIISRVRRECEAQGGVVSRRGYSRRTTSVMNVNSQAC